MSHSYERIQERAEVEFVLLRARLLVEQERFFNMQQMTSLRVSPKFLHVLVPRGENKAFAPPSEHSDHHKYTQHLETRLEQTERKLDELIQALSAQRNSSV